MSWFSGNWIFESKFAGFKTHPAYCKAYPMLLGGQQHACSACVQRTANRQFLNLYCPDVIFRFVNTSALYANQFAG